MDNQILYLMKRNSNSNNTLRAVIDKSIVKINDNKVTSIGAYVFRYCTELIEVDFPEAIEILDYSFQGSTKLAKVSLEKVTTIGSAAFNGCTALSTLIINNSTPPTLARNALTNTAIVAGSGAVYVPDNAVDTYKADSSWNTFSIMGMSDLQNS